MNVPWGLVGGLFAAYTALAATVVAAVGWRGRQVPSNGEAQR